MKEWFETVYSEALQAGKVDGHEIIGRANTVIQSYNDCVRYAKDAGAERLGVEELKQVPSNLTPENIRLGYERVGQVSANLDKALIALGFPIIPDPQTPQMTSSMQLVREVNQVNQLTNLSLDQLIEMIQQENIAKERKDAAAVAIREFKDEITKPRPEPNKLKQCIDTVIEADRKFGIPLLFKVLENWNKILH